MTEQIIKPVPGKQVTEPKRKRSTIHIPETESILSKLDTECKGKWKLLHKTPPYKWVEVDYCRQCGREGCYQHCGYGIGRKRKKVRTS